MPSNDSMMAGGGQTTVRGGFDHGVLSGDVVRGLQDQDLLRQHPRENLRPVTTLNTEEDAIRLANASEFGFASYLYSRDFNRLLRVAEQIEFGMVGFNTGVISNAPAPFGGVVQFGLGGDGGTEYSTTNTSASPIRGKRRFLTGRKYQATGASPLAMGRPFRNFE